MNSELLNILSKGKNGINNQKLIDYLNDRLTEREKHEVEQWMSNSEMVNEAMEGLQHIKNKKNLQSHIDQLNKDLHEHLQQKKTRKNRRKIQGQTWAYIAIILVLTLCLVAYIIVRKTLHSGGF